MGLQGIRGARKQAIPPSRSGGTRGKTYRESEAFCTTVLLLMIFLCRQILQSARSTSSARHASMHDSVGRHSR